MWEPLATILVKDHHVIIPDLRGMGLSSHPEAGYEKTAQARDLAGILDVLKIERFQLVTHDIGNMVGYALAAQYPSRVESWVLMDAPLPGLGNWAAQLTNPKVWHFNFRGPDVERLVKGRERILLDRFYNELSANPAGIDEQTRVSLRENSTRGLVRCITRSAASSPRSCAMPRRTRYCSRKAANCDADSCYRWGSFLWSGHEDRARVGGDTR